MRVLPRSVLQEPSVPDAPRRVWRDWAVLAAAETGAIIEVLLRRDLPWRWPMAVLCIVLFPTLLWRRTHPLLVVAISFGAMAVSSVAQIITGTANAGLNTAAVLLLSLYALCRWGSGRDIAIGAAIVLVTGAISVVADSTTMSEAVGGYTLVGVVIAIGLAVRFRRAARQRDFDQVRLLERERIARDLHDTVAHHVSAIAVRAQAGIAVAPTRPDAALDALRVIETEASRTLAEMRSLLGVLRRDGSVELAPTPTLDDLRRLATQPDGGPAVVVAVADGLDDLNPTVASSVFRLAQESVTNAQRHARHATRIAVTVTGDRDHVQLRVVDDGDPVNHRDSGGYGIVGMAERAEALGGSCIASPRPDRGWVVTAILPRNGGHP